MTILRTLKQKLAYFLFRAERKEAYNIIEEMKDFVDKNEALQKDILDKSKDPTFLLQQIAKKFGPFPDPLGEFEDVISYIDLHKDEITDKDTFFSEIEDVFKNESFKILLKILMKEQIVKVGVSPETEFLANYARATLNGFQIVSQTIEDIHTYNMERNQPEEQFDEHGIINGED